MELVVLKLPTPWNEPHPTSSALRVAKHDADYNCQNPHLVTGHENGADSVSWPSWRFSWWSWQRSSSRSPSSWRVGLERLLLLQSWWTSSVCPWGWYWSGPVLRSRTRRGRPIHPLNSVRRPPSAAGRPAGRPP